MRPIDILECVRNAIEDRTMAARLRDALRFIEFFETDAAFAKYAHAKYLPAAREYREYLQHGGEATSQSETFRRLRATLGGTSRYMYRNQRETLEKLLDVLALTPLKPFMTSSFKDHVWAEFQTMERKWLHDARRY